MKKVLALLLVVAMMLSGVAFAKDNAADWPKKTINMVVGYTAGGDSDLDARLVAKYLAKYLDCDVIVTNTNGASGMVAAAEVADSNPDGYTVYWGHGGVMVTQAYGGASVDMLEDFEMGPGILTDNTYTLCVASNTGIKNYQELVDYLTANPEGLSIVANAKSGNWYTVTNMEKSMGVTMKKVEGAGAIADRIIAMLAGSQQLIYTNYAQMSDYIEKGDLTVIGTISTERAPLLPDVPTLTELGGEIKSHYFFGTRFAKGTPAEIIEKFTAAMKQVSEDPDFQVEAAGYGVNVTFATPEEYKAFSQEVYQRGIDSLD